MCTVNYNFKVHRLYIFDRELWSLMKKINKKTSRTFIIWRLLACLFARFSLSQSTAKCRPPQVCAKLCGSPQSFSGLHTPHTTSYVDRRSSTAGRRAIHIAFANTLGLTCVKNFNSNKRILL